MSLTKEQQATRAKGIGASETPAILGLDRYRSAIDIYLKKLGLTEDVETFHTQRGTYLEPALRKWASDKIGIAFEPCDPMTHPEQPRVLATPDGVKRDGARIIATLEIKSPGPRMVHEWEDSESGAPDRVVVQTAQQLAVTGAPVGYIAAFLGDDLRIYRIERDRDLEAELVERVNAFWRDHIETQTPPPADGSESHREWLAKRFPRSGEKMLPADERARDLLLELRAHKNATKEAEAKAELCEQRIKELIGDARGVEFPYVCRATWTNNKPTESVDWQAAARHLGATREHEIKFRKSKPGPRVFRTHFFKESK